MSIIRLESPLLGNFSDTLDAAGSGSNLGYVYNYMNYVCVSSEQAVMLQSGLGPGYV